MRLLRGVRAVRFQRMSLFIAGESTDGPVRVGNRVRARVPAKRAPEALEMIIDHYKANRNEGEELSTRSWTA